jgi:2,4-dichlorophenol 6-monooxygenase
VLEGRASDALLDSYEAERMPVAARNVEHSLRNAGRHAPVAAALGLAKGQSEEEGWAQIAIWASDTPEGERRRAAARAAVAHNAEDYSQLNIEAGFAYESGAVIPDGTPPPLTHHSAISFESTARPGHHIPHVWLERSGEQISTSDLVAPVGLTLFVDSDDAADWIAAATRCPDPVTVVEIGAELTDPAGEWAAIRGTTPRGAVLVRPDRHVAWRTADLPADPVNTLAAVHEQLLRPSTTAPAGPRDVLAGITEAGEALRVPSDREARLFTVAE